MSRKRSRYEQALVEREADEEDESSADEGSDREQEEQEAADESLTQQQKRLQIALNKTKGLVCHVSRLLVLF
jgi:16S rRNA U516 pseudouridylate synthase RsuA-like enzyme